MSSLVYFEIFRASKHFATANERTRKGLLARMHAYMIDQLVFGLERLELARTILPVACVHGLIGRRRRQRRQRIRRRCVNGWTTYGAHVLNSQMRDYVVHGKKCTHTQLLRVLIDPFACVFLFVICACGVFV